MKYVENAQDLGNRIRAHKLFSKATLESAIQVTLDRLESLPAVLDLGCGSGNYFDLLAGKADCYIGVDVNDELLLEFAKKTGAKKILIRASMDALPEFSAGTFGAIYAIYSIYYSEDPQGLVRALHRFLADSGQLVVLGPGKAVHAPEISGFVERFSKLHTGSGEESAPAGHKNTRVGKFHNEIVPLIEQTFSSVRISEVDTSLAFPDSMEWANYVVSTPEARERFPATSSDELVKVARRYSEETGCRAISKSMLQVLAHK